jgi:hypothetical protein
VHQCTARLEGRQEGWRALAVLLLLAALHWHLLMVALEALGPPQMAGTTLGGTPKALRRVLLGAVLKVLLVMLVVLKVLLVMLVVPMLGWLLALRVAVLVATVVPWMTAAVTVVRAGPPEMQVVMWLLVVALMMMVVWVLAAQPQPPGLAVMGTGMVALMMDVLAVMIRVLGAAVLAMLAALGLVEMV